MTPDREGTSLVLGVGNPLWADEGVGPRLITLLQQEPAPPDLEILDGGTQGLYLLPLVTAARRLLLVDAVDLNLPAGTVVLLREREVDEAYAARPLSLHQTSLQDLLSTARLCGWQPDSLVLVGIQVADTESWGGDLSPAIAKALPQAFERLQGVLRDWRDGPAAATEGLGDAPPKDYSLGRQSSDRHENGG